jgi:hypothetical protein
MHYRDGTPAQLYDVVKGKPYNTPNEVVGVVGALNSESTDGSCGIYVLFADVERPWGKAPCTVLRGDYGTVGEFDLVRRP